MAKAIYADIGGTYVKLRTNTRVPKIAGSIFQTSSKLEYNQAGRTMTASIWLNGLEEDELQTNRGMYIRMVEDLKKNKVTEIPEISDKYILYVDYSIYNEKDQEINHSCTSKRIEAVDAVLPLGVSRKNECVFRQVKLLEPKLTFSVTNRVPFGVMARAYGTRYTVKINDVIILQSINDMDMECYNAHNSIQENSYSFESHTVHALFRDHIPVYASSARNLDLGEFTVDFWPQKICISLHLALANLIVIYDDQVINDILLENASDDNPSTPIDPPIDPDTRPPADGDRTPDANGMYDYYERCSQTTPDSILVVADDITDEEYVEETMIKYSDIVADIPDIEVGEYVRYFIGFDISKL